MGRIAEWTVRFRLAVLGIAAAVAVASVALLPHAPLDAVPEFTPPYVEVQTEALGLSAEEVEQLITVPLEADLLNGVAWLESIRSESVPGLSSIVLVFEPGTDINRARQVVAERLTQAPCAARSVSKPPSDAAAAVVREPGHDDRRSPPTTCRSIDMSVLARWTIRPRLMGVPGVANVVDLGPARAAAPGAGRPGATQRGRRHAGAGHQTTGNALWVSPLSFLDASTPGTGGFIDTPNQRLGDPARQPDHLADELAQVALEPDGVEDAATRIRWATSRPSSRTISP